VCKRAKTFEVVHLEMQTKNYDARGDVNVRKVTNICSSLNFRFVHLSIGLDVAWAVDSDGKMWMRIGDVNHPKDKESGAVPVWIPVESASSAETKFSRVSASSSSSSSLNIVWAVGDGDGRVYARLGIYGNFRLGLDWTAVPGVTNAVDVKASDSAVYVLTGNGRVLRRRNLSLSHGLRRGLRRGQVWLRVRGGEGGGGTHQVRRDVSVDGGRQGKAERAESGQRVRR
jgi:hypothetical protein